MADAKWINLGQLKRTAKKDVFLDDFEQDRERPLSA